jgi:hypothetical protein
MNIGDLVEFLPKNYGTHDHSVPDQWAGVTGMILKITERWLTILLTHPDDGYPTEISAAKSDVTVISTADGELTNKQLEHVVGGRSDASFEKWRVSTINGEPSTNEM